MTGMTEPDGSARSTLSDASLRPWLVEWTPERTQRFWNWYASQPQFAHRYFSLRRGDALLRFVARHVALRGTVVDCGAGPGHLTAKLLARGVTTIALDSSETSIHRLAERWKGHPQLQIAMQIGACVPLPDATADVVFVVEAIEHMPGEMEASVFAEMHRILRPGGSIVVTTPNEEQVEQSHTICPNCACVFSTTQHVRSFSAASLTAAMSRHGFSTRTCVTTHLSEYAGVGAVVERLLRRGRGDPLDNLVYIGTRQ